MRIPSGGLGCCGEGLTRHISAPNADSCFTFELLTPENSRQYQFDSDVAGCAVLYRWCSLRSIVGAQRGSQDGDEGDGADDGQR